MRRTWLRRVLAAALAPLTLACVETTVLQTSPTGGVGSDLPPADPVAVTSIEVFPSSARFTNGEEFTFTVVTRVGVIEALAVFSPSVEDISVASVIGANQSDRTVIIRGRGPGETSLVVRSGGVQVSVPVRVIAASPE